MRNLSEPAPKISSKLFFTIHLDSPNDKTRLDEHDRVSVIHKITQKFDSFTLVDGKGFWNGRFEDTLLIHIATNDTHAVAELTHSLRNTFNQEAVGIQFGQNLIHVHRANDIQDTIDSIKLLNTAKTTATPLKP